MAYRLSDYLAAIKQLLNANKPGVDVTKAYGGDTVPTCVAFTDSSGTTRYTWYDTSGNLRIGTTEPTAFTDGSILSAADSVQQADVTLTSAQVLALNATPISVIAAPGANKAIIIESVVAYTAGGTAYAGIAVGEDLVLRYTNGSGTILTGIETTGWLDQTTAQTRVGRPQSAVGTHQVELTPTANAAVVAHLTTGEITTGNYDIKLRVYYRVVPTVLT